MTGRTSDPLTLTVHAVRLLGFASTSVVARRFDQPRDEVEERLRDVQAYGWVSLSEFAGTSGWSLTRLGRNENERLLADELTASGARATVVSVHDRFVPLNAAFMQASTRWQLRPHAGDPLAANDHTDFRWDGRVIDSLASIGRRLTPLIEPLEAALARFSGYGERYLAAVGRVSSGQPGWVDGLGIDSCQTVWMQLHEDLVATLGLDRSN